MSDELRIERCKYRIHLMEQRDPEGNKHLIGKLKRIIRRLEAE